jgi:hypothetical protein
VSAVAKARSRVAVEVKKRKRLGDEGPPDAVEDARRVLAEEKIKAFVEQTVASAPPLSAEQRARLAVLLGGGAST